MFHHADDDGGSESMKQEEEQHMSSLPDYFSYHARESKIWTLESIYKDVILFTLQLSSETRRWICILQIIFIFNHFSAAKRWKINFIVRLNGDRNSPLTRTFTTHSITQ